METEEKTVMYEFPTEPEQGDLVISDGHLWEYDGEWVDKGQVGGKRTGKVYRV